jgi:hypothetical protein
MGVKPKADTPEQLMKWMSDFLQAQKTMKEDSETKFAFSPPPKTDPFLLLPLKIFGLQSTWHLCHSSVSSCSLLRAAIFHKWHLQIFIT